ncbi:23S rRNA (uracil(1939)-C(5))-methyltransferase RlmD [Agaribacter flavus]|uniref:23S rRNA (Uracil(1939)-C(5))-methyltransferase RlmD n=1 Tax=Agaribacter flavus TaxID=1902781 RepID=A0ABV7FPB0_9ALTE
MAKVFKAKSRRGSAEHQARIPVELSIDTLDYHGIGVCLSTVPITLVSGGLPNERLLVSLHKSGTKVQTARIKQIIEASEQRQAAFCQHYDQCGGCSMQHLSQAQGISQKTQALKAHLAHKLALSEDTWQPSIESPPQYRRKVRLSVDARNPKQVKIGYRVVNSNTVVDISACAILTLPLQKAIFSILPHIKLLPSVRNIGHLVFFESIDGVSMAVHCSKKLRDNDASSLAALAKQLQIDLRVLHKQEDKTCEASKPLRVKGYQEQNLQQSLQVGMSDFVQINEAVNQQMLVRAIAWLSPTKQDIVYDFFAGAGNFSLAMAARAAQVYAYEVSDNMVKRCQENAQFNGLGKVSATKADLDAENELSTVSLQKDALVVLDPARSGAKRLSEKLAKSSVRKVLYVSCNPSTFVRDLGIMRETFRVEKICTLDMFPFTEHMEVMALLVRKK